MYFSKERKMKRKVSRLLPRLYWNCRSVRNSEKLPVAYRRYLVNEFRAAFKLKGVPLQVEFKTGDNPFKDRKNKLTPRQIKSRKRMIDRWH